MKRGDFMEQFAFKFHSDEIEISYTHGAMYAYAPGIPFDEVDIELGDKILKPGEFISKMGEKLALVLKWNKVTI